MRQHYLVDHQIVSTLRCVVARFDLLQDVRRRFYLLKQQVSHLKSRAADVARLLQVRDHRVKRPWFAPCPINHVFWAVWCHLLTLDCGPER